MRLIPPRSELARTMIAHAMHNTMHISSYVRESSQAARLLYQFASVLSVARCAACQRVPLTDVAASPSGRSPPLTAPIALPPPLRPPPPAPREASARLPARPLR